MKRIVVYYEKETEPREYTAATDDLLIARLGREIQSFNKSWTNRWIRLGELQHAHQYMILQPTTNIPYPYGWRLEYGILGIVDGTVVYGPHPQCIITFMRRAILFIEEAHEDASTDTHVGRLRTDK